MSRRKQAHVIREHTHIGELPDGRRVKMVWTEYPDHILTQTDDILGPEAEEWVGEVFGQYDDEALERGDRRMKPVVCIGVHGKAKAFLFEGGCALGPISTKEAKILSRYNGVDAAKILSDHNGRYGL